jgi:type IV pilus assembly protein PilC
LFTKTAIDTGGIITGAAIVILLVLAIGAVTIDLLMKKGFKVQWAKGVLDRIKNRNKIALSIAKRRFAGIMSITVKSGMDLKKGLDMAEGLVENKRAIEMIQHCKSEFTGPVGFYEAIKISRLFTGMDLQLLKVGSRSGRLGFAMDQISERYEEEVDTSIETMIGRFEPTMVAVLAIIVGMILFAVMMPLVGILSSIG